MALDKCPVDFHKPGCDLLELVARPLRLVDEAEGACSLGDGEYVLFWVVAGGRLHVLWGVPLFLGGALLRGGCDLGFGGVIVVLGFCHGAVGVGGVWFWGSCLRLGGWRGDTPLLRGPGIPKAFGENRESLSIFGEDDLAGLAPSVVWDGALSRRRHKMEGREKMETPIVWAREQNVR